MRTIDVFYRSNFQRAGYFLMIRYLYVLHFLTRQHLHLKFISISRPMFAGNFFTLYFEVLGCHEIHINDSFVLPGNISRLSLDPAKLPGPLVIRLKGCDQEIVKTWMLSPIDLGTKQLSNTVLSEPKLQVPQPSLSNQLHKVELPSPALHLPLPLHVRDNSLKIRKSLIQVTLEECQLPEFNP